MDDSATGSKKEESDTNNEEKTDEKSLLSEVPSLSFGAAVVDDENSDEDTGNQTVEQAPKKTDKDKKPAKNSDTKKSTFKGGVVVLHPKSKIWIGYTNLKSMKRAANVTTADVVFNTSKAEYIVATGHGKLKFTGKGVKIDMENGKKHFFKISKKGVEEISHELFQKLNQSKVW